ncbi:MAG: arginine repressor [Eggerthellaceae bacterium]|jgi:transcriptional regulator of arginine metabolism
MRKRLKRHDVIRNVIRDQNVKTQRELAKILRSYGYDCTQATVSRDITDMGLVKSHDGFYVLPEEMRLERMVSDLVEEVAQSANLLVIHTTSGGAAGVSAALDAAQINGVLGTVAGDNTIVVVAGSDNEAGQVKRIIDRLRK